MPACPRLRFAAHLAMSRRKTRGHGWSLLITTGGTATPYPLPAFTGASDLTLKCSSSLLHPVSPCIRDHATIVRDNHHTLINPDASIAANGVSRQLHAPYLLASCDADAA